MQYRLIRAPLLALIAVVVLAGLFAPGLTAQESTLGAGGPISVIELAPGFTAEILAAAPSDRAPGQTVYLARFVIQPGAEIFPHGHPGTTVLA